MICFNYMGSICHEVVVLLMQMIQMTQFSQERLSSIFEETLKAVFTIIMVLYIHVVVYGHCKMIKHIYIFLLKNFKTLKPKS